MLGALECSASGDIANWIIPGKMCRGMGGAMDLVASESQVIVTMQHYNRNKKTGEVELKLLKECSLPITAKGVVSMVITELAVFKNIDGELVLVEIASETNLEEVQKYTGFPLKVAAELKQF
jgi:3-oxoacid CoA-transferase B subunit